MAERDDAVSTIAPSDSPSQRGPWQPSAAYLERAALPPSLLSPGASKAKLLVVDLNNCLLARQSRSYRHGVRPLPRPYLSALLSFVLRSDWQLMVWSSSKPHNIENMVRAIGLLPNGTSLQHLPRHLVAIWTRMDLDLSPEDYERKCQTVKDLDKIFAAPHLGKWTQANVVLLDDSSDKATIQPHNHIHLPLFDPFGNASYSTEATPTKSASSFVGRSAPSTPATGKPDILQVDSWRRTSDWVSHTNNKTSPSLPSTGGRQDPAVYASFSSPSRSPTSPPKPMHEPFRPSPHFSIRSPPRGGSPSPSPRGGGRGQPPVSPTPRTPSTPLRSPPPPSTVPSTVKTAPTNLTTESGIEDWSNDATLLRVIAVLDTLSPYADVSSAIRSGVIEGCFDTEGKEGKSLEDRLKALWIEDASSEVTATTVTSAPTGTATKVDWEQRGREVCDKLGIKVEREFDEKWLDRLPKS